jgi:acetaldehyde dehydrogenase (acetylating)
MLNDPDLVAVQEVRTKVEAAWKAFQKYRTFTQQQVDAIVEHAAASARAHARRLAELAVEETGMGRAEDKLAKNLLSAEILPRAMRGMRTVGIVREDSEKKVVEIAVPMGVVAAILPTTNPTSTAIYKVLIALKAGNAIVLSPHPRARRCTCETAALLARAAEEAGAPEGTVQCATTATLESTQELMRHKRTSVILSTGGSGIVRAAYSSGKPAFGVGPGNVPVLVDTSADVPEAVARVVAGKSFDYGTVCSSEQTIVAEESLRERVVDELKKRRAFFCDAKQTEALTRVLLVPPNWGVNPQCVGQAPGKIAKMAGFEVPPDTSILVVEIRGVGREHPMSAEKLSPVLSLLFVKDFDAALCACEGILRFGGLGHTCVIHAKDDSRIRQYGVRMPAMRVLVNTSAPQGSTGITANVFPAMTLGCGAVAGNSTGDNIGPQHLINTKRLAYEVRKAEEAFEKTAAAAVSAGSPADAVRPQAPATIAPPIAAGAEAAAGPPDGAPTAVTAAVDRWLERRGISVSSPTEEVVDRFLRTRKSQTASSAPVCPVCPTPAPEAAAHGAAAPMLPAAPAPPPKPSVSIVDFVCENDVRAAIHRGQKIYIGPKTIVTPAARDLAAPHEILVTAQRP